MITVWGIIIVLSIIVEILTIDLVSIWFSIGGVVAIILAFLKMSIPLQIGACLVVSIISMIIIRPVAKKYLRTNTVKTNADRLIGKVAAVSETIPANGKGRVLINGEDWLASSQSHTIIEKNKEVEIVYIEGAHVVVKEL